MINGFDDFCTMMFIIVDDTWQQIAPLFKRPGPKPKCSDSELITMALIDECRGWDQETELINNWHEHQDLFPNIPSRSRFNRRRRNLMFAINLIRQTVLKAMDIAQDTQCVLDSLPVPVVEFYLVPGSTGAWAAYGARFGRVSSKKETIYGYKLHLLITLNGLILDFELAPANATDLKVGAEILAKHANLTVVGDKGYIDAQTTADLLKQDNITLLTLPRKNQKKQLPKLFKKLINSVRQIIETVNSQLAEQFNIERTYAHSLWGLAARLYTKLAAHTLCIYINRLLGKPDFLRIKSLAFP